MEAKVYVILLVLLALFLLSYILIKQSWIFLKSGFVRLFGKLKIKNGKANNFKVKEKFNKHSDTEGIISTCLFGNDKKYVKPLLKPNCYKPEKWYVRVYLCPKLLNKYKTEFLKRDYEIFVMEEPSEGLSGTIWRFLPLCEGEKFLSLDADDFTSENTFYHVPSKYLFKQWKESEKPFIFFAASFCSPVMAGKWGSYYKFPGLVQLLEKYDFTARGYDEVFLRTHVYPIAINQGFIRLKK